MLTCACRRRLAQLSSEKGITWGRMERGQPRPATYPGDDIPPVAGKLGVLGADGPYDAGRYAAGPGGEEDDPMGEERAEARPVAGVGIRRMRWIGYG